MRPLALDLCCGTGGWTDGLRRAGFDTLGVDIEPDPTYEGRIIQADLRDLQASAGIIEALYGRVHLIVASPPCQEFSRHDNPWTRSKRPPDPDLTIVRACYDLAKRLQCPIVLENVRGAIPWLGMSVWSWHSFHLWGDGVPPLSPPLVPWRGKKNRHSARDRGRIPDFLADYVAFYHQPNRLASANRIAMTTPAPSTPANKNSSATSQVFTARTPPDPRPPHKPPGRGNPDAGDTPDPPPPNRPAPGCRPR